MIREEEWMAKLPRGPRLTVDAIIRYQKGIVLVERKHPPYGWALPGGFVDWGESVEQAVRREVEEEVSLRLEDLRQFRVYSDPQRDPRGHTVSVVFEGRGSGDLKAASDARRASVFPPTALPKEIAFDHGQIIDEYLQWSHRGPVFETIARRRSVRTFSGTPIPDRDLEQIVRAGSCAPSAMNRQMWDFIIITDPELLPQILQRFEAGKPYPTFEDGRFEGATAAIAVVMDPSNPHWREDGAAATENMLLSARALGYGSCWVQGQIQPYRSVFKQLLGIPEYRELMLLVILGEPRTWPQPPSKKDLKELIHWQRW